jgi:hypothetical protein
MLVEYAGLNPMGGLHSDGVPKAGCPVVVTPFSPYIYIYIYIYIYQLFVSLFFYFGLTC